MTSPGMVGADAYVFGGAPPASERQVVESLVAQMDFHRQSMLPWFRDLGAFFSPRAPRIDIHKENKGNSLNRHILDETAIYARRTLTSGLSWGITNPSRQWKALTVTDAELAEQQSVKDWLYTVNERMDAVLSRSNFYRTMTGVYDDSIIFANAAFLVEEDDEDVIRCVPFGVGSYAIADDAKGNVAAFCRFFIMPVRQMAERFGTVNGKPSDRMFSQRVKDAIRNKRWEDKIEIVHVICPNEDYDGVRDTPDAKRFASYYYEQGARPLDSAAQFLAKEGYSEWPIMMFRWRRVPDDPWGIDCPAMSILGTNKSAQKMESKALKLVDKAVDPALVGPTSLQNKRVSLLPGDITTDDDRDKQLRPIHEVQLAGLQAVSLKQEELRSRIHDAFYTRLMTFVLSTLNAGGNRTATEIQELSNEKYLVLGNVMETWNETLSQLVDRVFAIMLRRGFIPDAPKELQGVALKVEYTSVFAQAQKVVGLQNIERFLGSVANLMQMTQDPSIGLKVDWEQAVDEISQRSGIPPRVVRSDADVAAIRSAQAESQRAMQAAEQAQLEADAASKLAGADTSGKNALTDLMAAGGQALTQVGGL